MPQNGSDGRRPRPRDASSAFAGSEPGAPPIPSSHLTDDQWRSIADSLKLTKRQLQIVTCVFDGLDEPSIAEELGVTPHTVHTHLNRLYRKLEVKSRCDLVVAVFLAHLAPDAATGLRPCPLAYRPTCPLAAETSVNRDEQLSAPDNVGYRVDN